jgi:glycosyltransferase involved in cell wall biosynthesis
MVPSSTKSWVNAANRESILASLEEEVLWLSPAFSEENVFVDQFTRALKDQGFTIENFDWSFKTRSRPRVVIMHWPDEFFADRGLKKNIKAYVKLLWLRWLKARGTRIVWVAHNLKPHDSEHSTISLTKRFFSTLWGIIYLSEYSKQQIEKHYDAARTRALLTVHGHYRDVLAHPASLPREAVDERTMNLAFVGQIRPYKGVLELAQAFRNAAPRNVILTIAGRCKDEALAAELTHLAAGSGISVDIRRDLLPQSDLDAAIDGADAVILPYRDILNSGSALLVLSRNRPVIAPWSGSFPELREKVGADWVYLYRGEFNADVIDDSASWLRSRQPTREPDLSPYDWGHIGRQLRSFLMQ